MATVDRSLNAPTPSATTARLLLLATFVAAIILSASLLFMVQPMFTKLVLPRFGGAPSVWSVAIVFFQTALLAGYAYAHWLTRYAPGRLSVAAHLTVMIAAVFALPLSIAAGWDRPPESGQALWLIGLFTASIGLPFFALAANSPLLQAGSRALIIPPHETRISCMPPAISEASSRSCPIRLSSSRSYGSELKYGSGRSAFVYSS